MRRYYWAAKAVTQLNQILMLNIEERVAGAAGRADAADLENFLESGGMLEVASDDLYERDPHAILETFLLYQQTRRAEGPVGAHAARALQRAPPDGREVPARPGQPRDLHGDPEGSRRPDARLSPDEPDQRARPLSLGLSPHRRPDAARPVPRLHRRPAHPDGAAQRAPLPDCRARPRVSVLHPARLELRAALGALHRRALPRHRQGPRRRPFRARHARGAALLPRSRHQAARTRR